jgi:signal transduction histidine kinase
MKPYLDTKVFSILIVIAIIAISYGLFFYFQSITENQIRSSLFAQQEMRQRESTKAIANHIESDLSYFMSNLRLLASSPSMQRLNDAPLSAEARTLTREVFAELNSYSPQNPGPNVDRVFVADRNGIILLDVHQSSTDQDFEGSDISSTEYFQEVRTTMAPVFSKGIKGLDENYKIALAQPIIDANGDFAGLVVAKLLTSTFFQHYGNIYDIQSQYLAVLDRDSVHLAHPVRSLVGAPFFGEFAQEATGRTEVLNELVTNVIAGQTGQAVYEFVNGERLTTGHPIYLEGEPTYFVFVITPTSVIYANIADVLSTQRIETFSLLAGTTATIFVLIVFLAMWNSNLRKAVAAKTEQLVDANKQLSIANEQLIENYERLRASDKLQKEFINVAAHELRTPVQPIIGLSDVLLSQKDTDPETRLLLETISRNAKRLYRLSSDILDVARIESKSLRLVKKEVDLVSLLKQIVEEANDRLIDNKVQLMFAESKANKVTAFVDSERVQQVLSNLLDNAVKFTEEGPITVSLEKNEGDVVVKVTDTGPGIHPDILPKLFNKFATKSEKGTGLGLYISRSIIEAHGGHIWAENKKDGRGAIFTFSLPLTATDKVQDRIVEKSK